MTEVPKIVSDRLRSALPEQTHPDADLLTAFAEQALSATERDGILQHLALCGDCRDVVALALPVADVEQPRTAPLTADEDRVRTDVRTAISRAGAPAPHKLSFAWPTLRWAALAAGVAVAAVVLLVHPGKLNQATLPSLNPQVATTVQPSSAPRTTSSSVASPVPSSQIASTLAEQSAVRAKTDEAAKSALRLSKKLKAEQILTPSPQAGSGMLLAGNKKDSVQADKLTAAPSPSAGARALDYGATTRQSAAETVEVTGAAASVTEPSAGNTLMARNNATRNDAPAIEKAKPAVQGKEVDEEEQKTPAVVVPGPARLQARNVMSAARPASTPKSFAPHITLAIKAGILQRSLDDGQSWQDALHADHPLLCYASHDEDLWAGGQAGALFHSMNSGVSWVQVQPSIKARQLASDITHIELRSNDVRDEVRGNLRDDARAPGEIILSTSSNEVWSSSDGGKTWDKK